MDSNIGEEAYNERRTNHMSKFTSTVKTIVKNLSSLAIDKYQHAKIITSSWGIGGFSYNSHKQKKLINEGYASNTDVYSIISKIIMTGSVIPIKIWKENPDGTMEEVKEGNFYDFIHKPDGVNSWIEWSENALGYQLLTGNEIMYGQRAAGVGSSENPVYTKVKVIPTQVVKTEKAMKEFFDSTYKYALHWNGKDISLDREDIKHIKYFNPTEIGMKHNMGLSPLQAGYQTLMSSNELQYANASAIKNRGANGLLSSEGDTPMSDEEKEDMQDAVQNRLGGGKKFNQIVATSARVKYTQFGLSPSDLKMIENGVLTLRQLCNLYNTDSSIFNDPANKKYNNLKEAMKALYINAVLPPLERHVRGFEEMVTPGWNEFDNTIYHLEIDTSGIEPLQDDQNSKVRKQVALAAGILNIITKVSEGKIGREAAINQLTYIFNMERETAEELIADTVVNNTNTNTNETNEGETNEA